MQECRVRVVQKGIEAPLTNVSLTRPRLVRIVTSTNWSMHDLILVDCRASNPHMHFET